MDKKEALKIIKKDGFELKNLPVAFLKDKKFILEAVQIDYFALAYAHDLLKKDKKFILEVIKKVPEALTFADKSLKKSKRFILDAVKQGGDGDLLDFIDKNKASWKVLPELVYGDNFQDCLMLVFGNPTTAVFSHMESIGSTVGYENNLIKIGGPAAKNGAKLVGEDRLGEIECILKSTEDEHQYLTYTATFDRAIERGTTLTYKPNFREDDEFVQCCYMDNRLGMWTALELAKTLENGVLVFSAWEEHGGGSVGYLARYLYEQLNVKQALIADITWVTAGVGHGKGVAVSLRDSGIPRRTYLNRIIDLAKESKIDRKSVG